jgi:hypothetical protein
MVNSKFIAFVGTEREASNRIVRDIVEEESTKIVVVVREGRPGYASTLMAVFDRHILAEGGNDDHLEIQGEVAVVKKGTMPHRLTVVTVLFVAFQVILVGQFIPGLSVRERRERGWL